MQEYFKILDVISQYDDRLLAIKGWGVTFGFAILATALKEKIAVLFLIASLSAFTFFILDLTYKNYQNNYYPIMRNIEIMCSNEKYLVGTGIDYGWELANKNEIIIPNNTDKIPKAKPQDFYDGLKKIPAYLPYAPIFFFGIFLWIRTERLHLKENNNESSV